MNNSSFARQCRLCAAGLLLALAGGCAALRPSATANSSFYSLDGAPVTAGAATRMPAAMPLAAPTLTVSPPHAASGFDSRRIIYTRAAHKLEFFAHNEWIDTPARMIAPLIVAAIEPRGSFRAVVLTPSGAVGDLRLDTEILRLQQDFATSPSRVRFTLRAYVVDNSTRQVLAWREFDSTLAAASDDPYAGVIAANRVVLTVLEQLAGFCSETADRWQASVTKR